MSKQLVLITGATGHIGFRTLVELLQSGYRARVTTRKLAQIEKIKAADSVKPYLNELEYHEIPDMTASGAFDEAVKGVDYILHLASPIPDLSDVSAVNVKKTYLDPAIQGTVGMLEAASKSSSVKRVIITSSVAILDAQPGASVITSDDLAPVPNPEQVETDPWVAYRASKILAYHATEEWMANNKPSWDLIHVLPAYVQGRNELVTELENVGKGSNDVMIDVATGTQSENARPSCLVWVNDVAKVEVAALDTTKGKNGDRYIASLPEKVLWTDISPIVGKLFPEAVKKGTLSLHSTQQSIPVVYDTSSTTKTFGIEFAGLQTMVKSLVGQYVELSEK